MPIKALRWQVMGLGAVAALAFNSCGASGAGTTHSSPAVVSSATIRIGTGLTPETRHAAYIYQVALQEAGYSAEVVETGRDRSAIFEQMHIDMNSSATAQPTSTSPDGDAVHITPDLSGDLLLYLTDNGSTSPSIINDQRTQAQSRVQATEQSSQPATSSAWLASATASPSPTNLNVRGLSSNDIVSYVDLALPDTLELLNPSAATNRYGYVVTAATAQKYGLGSMSDLGEKCAQLSLVAPDTYTANPSGENSLREYYGCMPDQVRTTDERTEQAKQLIRGQTDLAYMFSASADISANNLTLLDDPERTQLAQNIVPLVRAGEIPQEARDIIDGVSAQLNTDSLIRLNSLTSGDNAVSETDAAHFWLSTLRG
ncbi:glycine betaine ABC transporter substrate-binding protein [Rothia sp. P5766]|uniref:glycine betaine ABC transporter substrate-binding protein n=1 Tax=Rothia sp. P5766 TaxID=3402656 RepID=UPI003AD84A6C